MCPLFHTALLLIEGEKYAEHKVWAPSWKRIEKKVLALKEKVDIEVRRSEGRGEEVKDMRRKSKPVEPIAEFTESGDLVWNEDLVNEIKKLCKPSTGGRAGGENRNQAASVRPSGDVQEIGPRPNPSPLPSPCPL